MRDRISWLLSATLLLGATSATAQGLPCTSVSPEVRDYVRQRGACRDAKPAPRPKASKKPKSSVSDSPTSARQTRPVPDVTGRSYADAARALANFKVERIDAAGAAPIGEVLAQDPAPGRPGSTVILHVSDGSLAAAASRRPVTAPVTATASSTTAAPASVGPAALAAPMAPQELTAPAESRGQFSTGLSANAALIFGAGALLGLLFGALLMRQRLLRHQPTAGDYARPTTLPQVQKPVDPQPADPRPESDGVGVSEPGASAEIRFAARIIPVETTIVFAPFPEGDEVSVDHSSDHRA